MQFFVSEYLQFKGLQKSSPLQNYFFTSFMALILLALFFINRLQKNLRRKLFGKRQETNDQWYQVISENSEKASEVDLHSGTGPLVTSFILNDDDLPPSPRHDWTLYSIILQSTRMKLLILVAFVQLLSLTLGFTISSGSVSVNQKKVEFGEFNTQEIKQLSSENLKDKIEIKLQLADKVEAVPHQLLIAISSAENYALASHYTPTYKKGEIKVTIPVAKLPEVLKIQDKLFISVIIADSSAQLYKNLVEFIPGGELKSANKYKEVPRIGLKPEIHHTFNSDPKTVNPIIPIGFIGVAVVLFLALVFSWVGFIGKDLYGTLKFTSAGQLFYNISFLLSLVGFELNFTKYYLGQNIFTTLFTSFLCGIASIYFGSRVLRHLAHGRHIGRS
ncbi:uncharacterized protein RJT21DRAFT_112559 [Scheffersomyces amazonensis]|uniref:uncharacterized protein n=1 Tax=Scheffersomyces amazonensis TaxID=1078765 RepID=UPI00315D3DAF